MQTESLHEKPFNQAKRVCFYDILHLFVIDSLALKNGLNLVQTVQPDGIELMPGLITEIIHTFSETLTNIPIVANGMIHTKEETYDGVHASATSLSVSGSVI